jgi:hypothetical protein
MMSQHPKPPISEAPDVEGHGGLLDLDLARAIDRDRSAEIERHLRDQARARAARAREPRSR